MFKIFVCFFKAQIQKPLLLYLYDVLIMRCHFIKEHFENTDVNGKKLYWYLHRYGLGNVLNEMMAHQMIEMKTWKRREEMQQASPF